LLLLMLLSHRLLAKQEDTVLLLLVEPWVYLLNLGFIFSNLGFLTAEASMFKLREKIASNERSDRHLR
jgi:hypothetical protein